MNESGNIFYDEMMNKLQHMEDALLDVQDGFCDEENINEIFRSLHTVKSTADLLGMIDVVSITHKGEDLLQEIRSDKVKLDDELCTLFLDLKKFVALLVDNLLNGIDLDTPTKSLLVRFEKKLLSYMPKEPGVKTVLVVDESFILRKQIKKIIEDMGHYAITSSNGTDGLEQFYNSDIDLIISDVDTPLIDGLGMIKKIKSDYIYEDIPVVLLVTVKSSNLHQIGRETGAKAWVLKPISKQRLEIVLKKLLDE
jgi:two-component system chemotaxis response regulator CheY